VIAGLENVHKFNSCQANIGNLTKTYVKVQELLLVLHPFIGLFSRTTWVSRYQKSKTSLDLNEASDVGF